MDQDQYRVLRVVVASPGDVKTEREIVPRVIDEVNRNIAHKAGLHLELYRWETDTHPGFHPLGPQGGIDTKLKIEDCDLLVGIFWRRFGTPVSDAKSGTEHEFRIAYNTWLKNKTKPQIFVYFSQRAYTPKSKEETDQWGLVLQFKKDFPKEGLWWDYKNKTEFETYLRNHLTQFLQEQSPPEQKPSDPAAAIVPPTLFQLPPPPGDFTGREAELRELREAIEHGGVHISGLQGQGGVGKTALALKLAAELAPRFPDAQIFLDLKGATEKPLTAAEALAYIVRSFHPEAKLPEGENELRSLFCSVLHGKRVLLLMDNARDAKQVQPLIPPEGSALLVTSRAAFTLPGLKQKKLDTLPPEDAKKFLLTIAPRIFTSQNQNAADAIAKACGYLALALRLAATAIAERADLDPAEYGRKLADESKRLKLLVEAGRDPSMEASIGLSYNLLNAAMQMRWRMLGVFPDSFDIPAAAAVWETADDAGQNTLSDLVRFSMLEWDESLRRYRLHDLMRDFARGKLNEEEKDATGLRHTAHYADVLWAASKLYLQGGDSVLLGLALFDLEWGNIEAGQAWAAARVEEVRRGAELCSNYPSRGYMILPLRQHPRQWISWLEPALASARKLEDRRAEGYHLGNLGIAYESLGEYRRAIEYHEQALAIDREIGDRRGEGQDLGNLGTAYQLLGEPRRAIEHYEGVLAINREIHDRRVEGLTVGNLGNAYQSLGEYRRAIEYHEQALVIDREIGDRLGEGQDLGNLGISYSSLGEDRRAIGYYEQQLIIAREIGDRRGEGTAHWNMSMTLYELGEHGQAIEHAAAALRVKEQIEDPSAAKVREQLEIWKNSPES
jgi:tetratricopeptide (TPR) repeat protein